MITRTGRPNSTVDHFWSGVDKSAGVGACWPWTRGRSPRGYGKIYFNKKEWRAHRLAFFLTHGTKPLAVCHHCDNPPCCNPDHLFAGDHGINSRDRAAKGRGFKPKGERHHHAKLTTDQVMDIRRQALAGVSCKSLSSQFRIHDTTVRQIIKGQRWPHLPLA